MLWYHAAYELERESESESENKRLYIAIGYDRRYVNNVYIKTISITYGQRGNFVHNGASTACFCIRGG